MENTINEVSSKLIEALYNEEIEEFTLKPIRNEKLEVIEMNINIKNLEKV